MVEAADDNRASAAFAWHTSLILTSDTVQKRKEEVYRATGQVGKNLLLTEFRQFWQLVGRYFSYLLPRQDAGTSQIQVNWRFLSFFFVTLYFDIFHGTLCNVQEDFS